MGLASAHFWITVYQILFFHLFFILFIYFFFIIFFHFSVLFSDSLDFAKCSSLFPNFLVENAAKHKKSMKKTKKMMRNEKK